MPVIVERATLLPQEVPESRLDEFPPEDWLIGVSLDHLEGVPTKYWKINKDEDGVLEMTAEEKQAVEDLIANPPVELPGELVRVVDGINLKNEDGSVANFPQTTRKTPIFQPSIVPPGYLFYGTGAFDKFDPVNGDEIGEGARILFKTSTPNDTVVVEGRFMHHVYILGGQIKAWSSDVDDEVSLEVVFPASTPAANGTGTGNAQLTQYGFFVPAAGDGSHDVDGSTLEAGEVNKDLCPVPAYDADGNPTGYWNWDETQDPSITPAPNGDGGYHLFAVELSVLRQANKYAVADLEVTPASGIQGKKVLPHWIWRFTMQKGPSSNETSARILLYTARAKTK